MAEVYGWPPSVVRKLTPAQVRMYTCDPEETIEAKDDWSQFGLVREGNKIISPDNDIAALRKYAEYKRGKSKRNR